MRTLLLVSNNLKIYLTRKGAWLIFVGLMVALLALFLYQYRHLINLDAGLAVMQSLQEWVSERHPAYFALLLAIAPLFGCPVSPLLVMAGGVYGQTMGVIWTILGMTLSNILAFWIAAYGLREQVEHWLIKRTTRIPEVSREESMRLILVVRLTPGIPFCLQNYFLGFVRVPFIRYLFMSFLLQLLPVCGFVIFGGSIFEGKFGLALIVMSLLVVIAIVARMVHARIQKSKNATNLIDE